MKLKLNINALPCLILCSGGIGAVLRILLYNLYVDDKGLLLGGSFPHFFLLIFSAAVISITLALVWKLDGSDRYADNFYPSLPGGLSAILAAVGIGVLLMGSWTRFNDTLHIFWRILGILSIPCLIFTGICRIQGRRPAFLFHGIVCLFFAIHLANHYRVWSGDPQLADYIWQLLASVGLTMTAYYRTAFDVGLGSRRMQLGVSLVTAYLCLLSAVDAGYRVYYLTCGLWALGALGTLPPQPRRRRAAPREVPKET